MTVRTLKLGWKIKAIQLDLARHLEPIEYLFEYIDAASKNGFNALVLYLEGRIRTKTFPYKSIEETYCPEEMKRVVAYASKKGIEIIPVIPALGHAEHILRCKELTHLCEERGGESRFGNLSPFVFCISQKETYDFIEKYFAEIAEIFPGKNFHTGLDEAWNFGFCPLCRKKWRDEGLGKMFVGHLKKLVKILGRLDKRMWMWDDMFEIFPEALKRAPRSIVMCHWNYESKIDLEGSQGHFVNRFRMDWLKEYEKLGFDAVFCPWDRYADNIEAITKHAKSKHVLGGLLTQWEGSPRFFAEQPFIAHFTGRLWSGASVEKSWNSAINLFYKGTDPIIRESLKIIISLPRQYFRADLNIYRAGTIHREERLERDLLSFAINCLTEKLANLPAEKKEALDKILWSAKKEMVFWGLRKIIPEIYNPRRNSAQTNELKRELATLSLSYWRLMEVLTSSLKKWNIGVNPDDQKFLKHYENISKLIADISSGLKKPIKKSDWLVVARLFLQDFHGSPKLKISVLTKSKRLLVAEGCFKPSTIVGGRTGGHYDFYFPLKCSDTPELVRIEGWFYGGQGICFVELKNKETTLKPVSIKLAKGAVSNASAILVDDSSFALLGGADIRAQMLKPELAERRGMIEVKLSR